MYVSRQFVSEGMERHDSLFGFSSGLVIFKHPCLSSTDKEADDSSNKLLIQKNIDNKASLNIIVLLKSIFYIFGGSHEKIFYFHRCYSFCSSSLTRGIYHKLQ